MNFTSLLSLPLALALAGCSAAAPMIGPDHPASAQAPETPSRALDGSAALRPDANTLRTRDLLARREHDANPTEGHDHP